MLGVPVFARFSKSTQVSSGAVPRPFVPTQVSVFVLALVAVTFFFTAWLGEDAFIDFRVVSNIVSGAGPVWNIGERVQVFTSPLWVGLLSLTSWLARSESPSVALALSLCCDCFVALTLVRLGLRRPPLLAIALFCVFTSQSYLDYSSSGLENPLLHAILAALALLMVRAQAATTAADWLMTSLACSAAIGTRLDAVFLVAPAWLFMGQTYYRRAGLRSALGLAAIGILPLVAWEAFSLFYYGSLVPNTALAKLPLGYPMRDLIAKGLVLIRATAVFDPGTLLSIVFAPIALLAARSKLGIVSLAASLGSLLSIVLVGGDFMQGRFLSGVFVLSWLLLLLGIGDSEGSFDSWRAMPRQTAAVAAALSVIVVGSSIGIFRQFRVGKFDLHYGPQPPYLAQVADERSHYNLVSSLRTLMLGHTSPWIDVGLRVRSELGARHALVAKRNVGMFGYAAGPNVFILDLLALSDPFLSRLPACPSKRAGHFYRPLPAGYALSLVKGANRIKDPLLAQLFDDVLLVTRAPLTQPVRLRAIARLHSGQYRDVKRLEHYTTLAKGVFNVGVDPGSENARCPDVSNGARTDILAIAQAGQRPPWLELSARW